ncbi:MAG: SNF2-related protein [Terrimicrobiaceae bacterium]
MGGWRAFKEARLLHSAGRVIDATYEPPLLKGRLFDGGKQFLAGLKLRNSIDVENLCPCRDSRLRGIICAHSLAVGLQVINPVQSAGPSSRAAEATTSTRSQRWHGAPAGVASPQLTDEAPGVELTLEGSLRHLEAEIRFQYSQPNVANPAKEGEALARLLECGFAEDKGKAVLRGEEAVVSFFAMGLPRLKESWQVKEGERFRHVTRDFVRIEPQFAIREKGDGWLDFHVHYAAGRDAVFSSADLNRLLQTGQGHFRLKDGRVAVADAALSADLEEVLRDCDPRQERGVYRVPAACRGYLEASISHWKGSTAQGTPVCELAGPAKVELGALKQKLRPYQVQGAEWLLAKARAGLGALLADEMGLGKTVQALALIEVLPGTTLVVCPSSLVWNWKREAERFLPEMSVLALDGPDREKRFASIPAHRLVVTSYALLRRDIERYRGMNFAAVVLDEAQHIKNPDSQNARAACALKAQSRFILTGTPVENSLRDLWSLFAFILPGYLGSRHDFGDRYETPLLNGERGSVWDRLNRRLGPYLMRRRKQEILAELPAKIEQVIEVELGPEQKTAYTQLQQAARVQVDELRNKSSGAARMRVLTALLRLRQACCDLRLLGIQDAPSSKLNALLELVEETIDGGHRALIFSQFTAMLDIIGSALEDAGISFCRLDGSTSNRREVVDRFQNDERIPLFLISLKAGGVGLNLTAADTVIHFDPWWNPAVEAQATDRAHRIGQRRIVTSIKLIARDTVEERVLRMQEKKRELLEGAVDAEAAFERLSAQDLGELAA